MENNKPVKHYFSAYGIACKHGFKGTEDEWLETLHGGDAILRYNSENKSIEFSHSKSEDWKYLFSLSEIVDEVTANDIIAAIEAELQAVQKKAQEVYEDALEASEEIAGYVVEAQTAKTNAESAAASAAASALGAERYSQNAMSAAAVASSSATEAKQTAAKIEAFAQEVDGIYTELEDKADKAEVLEISSVEFGWTEYPYTLQYNDEFSAQDFKNGYSDSCIEIGMPNTATINCKGSVLGFTVEITGSSVYSLSINGNEVLKGELGETEPKSYTLPPTLINENKIVLSGSITKFVFSDMKLYEGEAKIKGLGAVEERVGALEVKADDTYTKDEVETRLDKRAFKVHTHTFTASQVGTYSKAVIDELLLKKADAEHTHDITADEVGAYSKEKTDELLAGKADAEHTHNITASQVGAYSVKEIDKLLDQKVDFHRAEKVWELVASYTHSGNRVIQPTALDKETGYFTCENHGLTEGQKLITLENPNYFNQLSSFIPFELYQRANYKNDRLFIRLNTVTVIDENTFALTNKSGIVYTYGSSYNSGVDVTKFFFETTDGGIFAGFDNLDIDMRKYDIKIVARNPHMRINFIINEFKYNYTHINPHSHDGGVGNGAAITPIYGAVSNGEAIWTYENGVLFNNSNSVARWGREVAPIGINYINESYMNNIFARDEDNALFAENPIINKLSLNTYYTDLYFRNGGRVEIWKKEK